MVGAGLGWGAQKVALTAKSYGQKISQGISKGYNSVKKFISKPKNVTNNASKNATKGAAKPDDFAKEPFLPDKAYNKNLPKQVEPGTKSLPKYDEFGNLKQIKYYDQYGREKGWIDYTNHGFKNNHTSPHWHEVQYDSQYPLGRIIDHRMDPNPPFK